MTLGIIASARVSATGPATGDYVATFTQADGAASGFANPASYTLLPVVGNRAQTTSAWNATYGTGGGTTTMAGYILNVGFTVSNDVQLDFDFSYPTGTNQGFVEINLANAGDATGYGVLLRDGTARIQRFAPAQSALTNTAHGSGSHCTWTRTTAGLMKVYVGGTLINSTTQNTNECGPTLLVYCASTLHPTTVAWIDNIIINDTITGP